MIDTDPVIDNVSIVDFLKRRGRDKSKINIYPTASLTVNAEGKEVLMKAKGRHDPCVLPRAVPMVDAMVALVLADHLLLNQAQCGLMNN